ncbi:hypothetical protein GW915_13910 [bacterium]|nr:hypothetical protein [bacterium]
MNLFSLEDLEKTELVDILDSALSGDIPKAKSQGCVALLFFENSTRTRLSFERAAQTLARPYMNFDIDSSSLKKGESFEETLEVLEDYDISTAVIRSAQRMFDPDSYVGNLNVISAGEGTFYHPTQAMGDVLALAKSWGMASVSMLKGKTLLIFGDLRHSRVAHSWFEMADLLGINLKLASPQEWMPEWGAELNRSSNLKEGLLGADAVMALRVQTERHSGQGQGIASFEKSFQCTQDILAKRPLLHPGPTNWGVELAPELKKYENSLIRSQRQECYRVRTGLLARF